MILWFRRWLTRLALKYGYERPEPEHNHTLDENEERLRSFIEQLQESVSIIDEEGVVVEWNPASERLSGIPRSEAVGSYYWDILIRLTLPERRTEARRAQLRDRVLDSLRTGRPAFDGPAEYKHQRVDGQRVITRQILFPIKTARGYRFGALAQDVTETKQAEESLRESEQKFRSMVQHARDAMLLCDTEGRISEWNQAAEELTGLSTSDVLGQTYWDIQFRLFPPEHRTTAYRERLREMIVQSLSTGQAPWMNRLLDGELVRPDGTHCHFQQIAFSIPAEHGFMIGSITRDASEHVRMDLAREEAELKLRQREEQYRQAVSAADAVPYYRDFCTDSYTFMGEGIHKITGYTAQEMTPELYGNLSRQLRMRGDTAHLTPQQAIELLASGQIQEWKADVEITTRTGERRWLADSAVWVFDEQGQRIGAHGIMQDITERKQAEEAVQRLNAALEQRVSERTARLQESENRFRALFESSSEAIFLLNPYNTQVWWEIVDCNPAACRMNGYQREELIGKPVDVLNVSQGSWEGKQHVLEHLRRGEHLNVEMDHRRKDGSLLTIETEITLIKLEDRELIMGVDRDITARKRAEQHVKQAVEALEAANKELESFSYSVSHDLRAPLRAIDGFSRILLDDYAAQLQPEAQRYLDLVCENARHMGRLIDDLLAFSRLGRQELRKQYTQPGELVEQVLDALQAEWQGRQVDIVLDDLPPCQADPALLRQVYANLLDNAFKFTRACQEARIEVGYIPGAEPVYFVRDNGIGFDMHYADKLFGVFQRLHSTRDYEGTGVGLATVQRVIHRHGGRIWAEAEVNKGATFYFTL